MNLFKLCPYKLQTHNSFNAFKCFAYLLQLSFCTELSVKVTVMQLMQ